MSPAESTRLQDGRRDLILGQLVALQAAIASLQSSQSSMDSRLENLSRRVVSWDSAREDSFSGGNGGHIGDGPSHGGPAFHHGGDGPNDFRGGDEFPFHSCAARLDFPKFQGNDPEKGNFLVGWFNYWEVDQQLGVDRDDGETTMMETSGDVQFEEPQLTGAIEDSAFLLFDGDELKIAIQEIGATNDVGFMSILDGGGESHTRVQEIVSLEDQICPRKEPKMASQIKLGTTNFCSSSQVGLDSTARTVGCKVSHPTLITCISPVWDPGGSTGLHNEDWRSELDVSTYRNCNLVCHAHKLFDIFPHLGCSSSYSLNVEYVPRGQRIAALLVGVVGKQALGEPKEEILINKSAKMVSEERLKPTTILCSIVSSYATSDLAFVDISGVWRVDDYIHDGLNVYCLVFAWFRMVWDPGGFTSINFSMVWDPGGMISLLLSAFDCRKMEYPRIVTAKVGVKTYLAGDVDFPLPMSVESREIAKKITRRIRESFVSEPMDLSSTFKGYAGDESLYTVSGNDSASESDMTLTSRKSFHHSNQPRVSSSHTIGSSVSKEAKKRLSERWKMSHRYQAVEAVAKGSTLGEMLAKPDKEIRAESLDPLIGLDGSSNRFSGNEIVDGDSPSGISSRDGWKDGQLKSSSGLKYVPAAYVGCGGPKTRMQRETLDQDSCLMLGKARARGKNEAIKGSCNKKKDSLSRKLRTSSKKPSNSFEKKQFKPVKMETKLRKIDVSAKQYLISEVPANTVHGPSSITDVEVDAENNDIIVPYESSDEVLPGPSPCWLEDSCSSTPSAEDSKAQEPQNRLSAEESDALQHLVPEPSSPASSKEANHPSPVSVLELPFTKDPSSGSECLERVSADLQALRLHLMLLKMESGEYEDWEMLIASDKDGGQSSIRVSEETALFEV